MSDFTPNYRSKGGVEVLATPESPGGKRIHIAGSDQYVMADLFVALFEPIPEPVMVSIPLDVARELRDSTAACIASLNASQTLRAAIEAAEAD